MRLSRFLAVFFTILFTSNAAMAECSANNCLNRIDSIFAHSSGIYIQTDGNETLLTCDLVGGNYIFLKSTHPNYDVIAAGLYTFYTTGVPVILRIVENSTDCELSYLRVIR